MYEQEEVQMKIKNTATPGEVQCDLSGDQSRLTVWEHNPA